MANFGKDWLYANQENYTPTESGVLVTPGAQESLRQKAAETVAESSA